MKTKALEHWRGILSIVIATITPIGTWVAGEVKPKVAAFMALTALLTSSYNWVDSTLTEAKRRKSKERFEASVEEMGLKDESKDESKDGQP